MCSLLPGRCKFPVVFQCATQSGLLGRPVTGSPLHPLSLPTFCRFCPKPHHTSGQHTHTPLQPCPRSFRRMFGTPVNCVPHTQTLTVMTLLLKVSEIGTSIWGSLQDTHTTSFSRRDFSSLFLLSSLPVSLSFSTHTHTHVLSFPLFLSPSLSQHTHTHTQAPLPQQLQSGRN